MTFIIVWKVARELVHHIIGKGLAVFKKHLKKRKDALLERLKQSQKISEEDADWLDNQANHVNEEALILASNYKQGISWLDSKHGGGSFLIWP
jgi:hypothetical protein